MSSSVWYCPLCQSEGSEEGTVFCRQDGARLRPIAERGVEWIGQVLADKYKILRFVAAGGTAEVYEAERVGIGKHVAVKLMHSALAASAEAIDRFIQEAKLVSLIAHPSVVAIQDFGTLPDSVHYMVMELLDGRPLSAELAHGVVPMQTALRYAMQTCEGLAAAHERDVIHLDIKPANIFLQNVANSDDLVVKILDLGIGRLFAGSGTPGTTAGSVAGTPDYMSPEQAMGHALGPASDIYSMGIVLYEMFLGVLPFVDDSYANVLNMHIHEAPLWRDDLAQARDVPKEAAPIVLRALAKSPSDRQGSMLDLQHDLASLSRLTRARVSQRAADTMPNIPAIQAPVTARELRRISRPAEANPPHVSSRPPKTRTMKRLPLGLATGADDEVVEVRPDVYWVGRRNRTMLECNSYLRVFRNGATEISVLIDPGPPKDFEIVSAKVASVIGTIRRLDYIHLNHQDPDVSFNAGALQQASPRARVFCSEDTFRLATFYGLDPKRFIATESFFEGTTTLPTGHKLVFVPTPFCHFRGAVMLFDPESCVLFSGDLFGGANATDLVGSERSWPGVEMFHQIYMPSSQALRLAASRIRRLEPQPLVIAPQHGSLVVGPDVKATVEKIASLPAGLDLMTETGDDLRFVEAANEVVREYVEVAGTERAQKLLHGHAGDGSFTRLFLLGKRDQIVAFKIAPQLALDALAASALASLPAAQRGDLQRSIREIFKQHGLEPNAPSSQSPSKRNEA